MSEKFAIGKSEFFVGMDLTNGLNPLKCKPILFGFLTFLLNYAKVQKKVVKAQKKIVNVQKKVVNVQKSFMNVQKKVVNDQKRVVNDQKRVVKDQKEVLKTRLYRLIISKLN